MFRIHGLGHVHIQVAPGPACMMSLEGTDAVQRMTATNGISREERLLLKAPLFQARDAFGNPVSGAGLQVTLCLAWATRSYDVEGLPALETSTLNCKTDKNGQASGRLEISCEYPSFNVGLFWPHAPFPASVV